MTDRSRLPEDRRSVPTNRMISRRLVPLALRVLGGLCTGACLLLAAPSAFAQGKLDARYEATLAGIPVGKGAWTIDIADDSFSAAASGGTSGLLKAFAGGSGTGAAQGRVVNGALVSSNYSATTTTSKKSEAIRIVAAGAGVRRSAQPRGLPHRGCGLRRAHALRSQARLQTHGNGEGRKGLSWPGGGLRGLFLAGRRLHPRPPRN